MRQNQRMYPRTLAIAEDDLTFATLLGEFFRQQGVDVTLFNSADDLLVSETAYGYDFYLIDLDLPGVSGLDLVRLLRRRLQTGIVVVTGSSSPEVVDAVLDAGADMYVVKPATNEEVSIAVQAIAGRNARMARVTSTWRLHARARTLTTPGGISLTLGDNDWTVMNALGESSHQTVSHAELCRLLGREASDEAANWLHATIYRLRRRVEAASSEPLPLQSQSRVGYTFRAPLVRS